MRKLAEAVVSKREDRVVRLVVVEAAVSAAPMQEEKAAMMQEEKAAMMEVQVVLLIVLMPVRLQQLTVLWPWPQLPSAPGSS